MGSDSDDMDVATSNSGDSSNSPFEADDLGLGGDSNDSSDSEPEFEPTKADAARWRSRAKAKALEAKAKAKPTKAKAKAKAKAKETRAKAAAAKAKAQAKVKRASQSNEEENPKKKTKKKVKAKLQEASSSSDEHDFDDWNPLDENDDVLQGVKPFHTYYDDETKFSERELRKLVQVEHMGDSDVECDTYAYLREHADESDDGEGKIERMAFREECARLHKSHGQRSREYALEKHPKGRSGYGDPEGFEFKDVEAMQEHGKLDNPGMTVPPSTPRISTLARESHTTGVFFSRIEVFFAHRIFEP